ncbi:MAG TPA: hypothetical protein VGO86_11585 [Candidatus Dormibacteraeota bacterium]
MPTPPDRRERLLTLPEARAKLGCGDDLLTALLDRGFPVAAVEGGEPRLDLHDVINVGLYSGSGQSVPELAQRALFRFASTDPERWTAPTRWKIAVEHRCLAGDGGEHAGGWALAEPDPERWGGATDEWGSHEGLRLRLDGRGDAPERRADSASATGTVRLEGRVQRVLAPTVIEAFDELVRGIQRDAPRFQWLPDALRADPDGAARLGVTDCAASSLLLERELGRLGFATRTGDGCVLGLVPTPHAWVEVLDDDGVWKALDPIFAAVAARVPGTRPEFAAFCLGSFSSRVLPWNRRAGEAIAVHRCGRRAAVQTTVLSGMARS